MKQGHGPNEQGHGPGRMAASYGDGAGSCSCCSIAVAGAAGAMDGDAFETRGSRATDVGVLRVAETRGTRAADVVGLGVVDGVGSVWGLRASTTALSGDGEAGIVSQ